MVIFKGPKHLGNTQYRADIDGLRAIAVISVVGFHAFPSWFYGGFIGVDIFFVISGFLISTIIVGKLEQSTFEFGEFYARRIRRIFPAMLLVLIACFAFGWFALLPDEYKQLGKHIAGGAGFIANFLLWKESGYFDSAANTKPLLHLWSLGIEEQFYIVWPIILWVILKKRINPLLVAFIIAIISFILNIVTVSNHVVATFYLPLTRFWELMAGSVLACYVSLTGRLHSSLEHLERELKTTSNNQAWTFNDSRLQNLCSTFGLAILVVGFLFTTKDYAFPGWWALLPVLGTVFIIFAGDKAWFNRKVLSNRLLVWLGLISYPLYLWHWPILSFSRILNGQELDISLRVAAVLSAVFLAWLTYRLVEKPVQAGRSTLTINLLLVLLMFCIGLSGYFIYSINGVGSRMQIKEAQLRQFEWNSLYNSSSKCRDKYISDDYCNISDPDFPPNAAIIGDSHANHFYWGLSEYYKNKGGNLINLGAGGCPPLIGIQMAGPNTSPNCYARTKPLFDYILNDSNIKTVYISFWHEAYFADNLIFTDNLNQTTHAGSNYSFVLNSLIRTVNILDKKGKKVVLIYDMPDLKINLKECFLARPIQSVKPCNLDNSIFVDDFDRYQTLVDSLAKRTPVKVFETHQFIEGNFPVDQNGTPTYRDHSHLSINGSIFFSDKYLN